MRVDDCFQLGHITKPHGLKGSVTVFLDTDEPAAYESMGSVFVQIENKLIPFFIDSLEVRNDRAIVKFEGIDTLEQAEELRLVPVFLPLNVLSELSEKSFYFHEIIGFTAIDEIHGELGVIQAVYSAGPQELLGIAYAGKEILVPLHEDIIGIVDREKSVLHITMPDGLLDIYNE